MLIHKVVHITSVHNRYDNRIFHKQCSFLAAEKFDVTLIVADGKGDEILNKVNIIDVGKPKNRLDRIIRKPREILEVIKGMNADLCHLHDPELLQVASNLKKYSKYVVFDDHEDLPLQVYKKDYLWSWSKKTLSVLIGFYEKKKCKKIDGVIAATEFIREKHRNNSIKAIDVNNYPNVNEYVDFKLKSHDRNVVSYVLSGLSEVRTIYELVVAANKLDDVSFEITGAFSSEKFKSKVLSIPPGDNIEFVGLLNREEVINLLSRTNIGIALSYPLPSSMHSKPTKVYEYMLAGIPVICSNIPYWEEIVLGNECGVSVDPKSPEQIYEAIKYLIDNPDIARFMGENGKKAAQEKYSWQIEFGKLKQFYSEIQV